MPYSEITKQKLAYKKALLKSMEKAWNTGITYAINELYKEAWKMYDSFIDQYYSYKTQSYIRHGETRPGTCRGINLYRGQQFKIKNKVQSKSIPIKIDKANFTLEATLNTPALITNISGEEMDGYRYNTTDEVLDMVIDGIRGVPQKGWWIPWTGSYNGKYFSVSNATMAKAFEMFDDYFDDMALDIMTKYIL